MARNRKTTHFTALRVEGVTEALKRLGNGFLQHPANDAMRIELAEGRMSAEGYFQELLRLVYRFLFLFTAEERGLLHLPDATDLQREIYAKGYSLARLRERAGKRRHYDRHHDLWQGLLITFRAISRGEPRLGLPALAGLFAPEQCLRLESARISNEHLLSALHALSFFSTERGLARANYRDMGTEELGSVYESLLELYPVIDVHATPLTFGFLSENGEKTKGSARKLSGSYYTPAALVDELIKSALEPVMISAVKRHSADPRGALLRLKIVDPACGSGHFLLAAARRLAAEIARCDAGSETFDEAARQHALREVVQHCIFGVDKNPLAVELCRTALWIETLEPGKPLTFLDHHIQCGDSLIGVLDLDSLRGIPDDAYQPLTGDDRDTCKALKKRNREAEIQTRHDDLFVPEVISLAPLSAAALDDLPEDSLDDIQAKRTQWEKLQRDPVLARLRQRCDLYCAAFFAPKTRETAQDVPLTEDLLHLARGAAARPEALKTAAALAREHRFFHWPLAFPQVFAQGGFDVVLGNPPWERIKLQEEEFFASRSPEIANSPNKAERAWRIARLAAPEATRAERALWQSFQHAKRAAEAASLFVHVAARDGGRYPLTGRSDVNTYALFAETILCITANQGRAGFIVPTGIATDESTKAFFAEISTRGRLVSLFDFENRERPFPAVDSRSKFCLLTLGRAEAAEFVFFATQTAQLADPRRRFTLSPDEFRLLNPNTLTCPVFRSERDCLLTKKLYRAAGGVLIDETCEGGNPWNIRFQTMFHMSNDSGLFATAPAPGRMPLYEAKLIHQFDHRFATYEHRTGGEPRSRDATDAEKANPAFAITPHYWVDAAEVEARLASKGWTRGWLMGWRNITNATNERTVVASVMPRVGVGNSLSLMLFEANLDAKKAAVLLGNLCSLVLDFVARHKVGGTNLNYFIYKQLPILPPNRYTEGDLAFIVPRVLELTYTAHDLAAWAADLGYGGPPFPWNPERRAQLRAELDAYYAKLYGLTRDELRYMLDPAEVEGPDYPSETFRVLKNNELRQFGEYRTQRLVLEAWDRLDR